MNSLNEMTLISHRVLAGVFLCAAFCVSIQAQSDRQLVQNGPPAGPGSKRIALVIGNGAYTSAPPLKNPPNDARDIAATLKTLGFDVTSGVNVSQRDMKRMIREFGLKLKNGGSGLFYYAGHGVQSKGRNYLIPVDANIQSEAEVEDSGVDAALVLNFMDDAQNGLNIVILDACRNNPFARSFRSANDGLAQVDAPTGTLIAYATAPGRVASDGTGQNGLYTSELLKQMQTPGVSITDVFMRVRAEVMKQTGNKQVPWEASSLVGSFYFAGASPDATTVTNTAKIDPVAFELSYWETIKNSTNADDFKSYLARYPQGQFVELAKNRIATLSTTPAKPAETASPVSSGGGPAELAFWDAIKNSTSADDYRAYLEKYPNGEFAGLAKRRLAPLEANEKEKAKSDEAARNIKRFKGSYMLPGAMGDIRWPGTLVVTPNKIEWVYDDIEQNRLNGQVYKPYALKCSDLTEARTDDVYVREIRDGRQRTRFQAESAAAANDALTAMRYVCANPGKNFPGSATSNPTEADSLTGTTWKGDSSGGDKQYEFQFLPNSEVVWHLQWGRLNNPTFRGTYTRTGSEIRMVFDATKVMGGKEEVAAVLSQDSLTGSWNFGRSEVRPDNGMYKFTVTRASSSSDATQPDSTVSLVGTTWKGDSPGGDKHYEFRFQAGGVVVWNQKMASNVTYEGIWVQNGNEVTMKFRGLEDPVLVTIQGNQMSGSWYHGRYQLTVTKVQ